MTVKLKDIPDGTEETPAMRLRQAREKKDFTRMMLGSMTGIPQKSIEKFENGSQEPTLSRLKGLSEALGVTAQWVMDGDSTKGENTVSITASTPGPEDGPANDNDPMDKVLNLLARLDEMRTNQFEGAQRGALALADETMAALKHIEPRQLLELASDRNLKETDCKDEGSSLSVFDVFDLFTEDHEKGLAYCESIEERILDTAIMGVDIHTIDRDDLVDLANELDIEEDADGFLGVGFIKTGDLVKALRAKLRVMFVSGNGVQLTNVEEGG